MSYTFPLFVSFCQYWLITVVHVYCTCIFLSDVMRECIDFFLRGCSNTIISFICGRYWFFKILPIFHSLVSYHLQAPCFCINTCHWKFTSNLGCGRECRDRNICKRMLSLMSRTHISTYTHAEIDKTLC